MTTFLKVAKITMGFVIDVLLIWTLKNEIQDHLEAQNQNTAPETSTKEDE